MVSYFLINSTVRFFLTVQEEGKFKMAIVHRNQRAKAESGYIVSGDDAKKLVDYLFNQTPEQIKASIEKDLQRYKRINARKIKL